MLTEAQIIAKLKDTGVTASYLMQHLGLTHMKATATGTTTIFQRGRPSATTWPWPRSLGWQWISCALHIRASIWEAGCLPTPMIRCSNSRPDSAGWPTLSTPRKSHDCHIPR